MAAAAAIAYGLWELLDWQLDPASFQDRRDFLTLYFAIIAGMIALLGVLFTWRRVAAAEETVLIAQEGQITERFTRAVEQLGSDKLAVRLGAIYALERIARDSERDHWPIMEILTAYVRENAAWKGATLSDLNHKPPADVQAILTVIGRRARTYQEGEADCLDLLGVDLRGASLVEGNWRGVNLVGAHLEGAQLMYAHLEDANLLDTSLERASLNGARLEDACLSLARLAGANLSGAHLEGADLTDATGLTAAQLNQAYLDANTKLPDYLPKDQIKGCQDSPPASS